MESPPWNIKTNFTVQRRERKREGHGPKGYFYLQKTPRGCDLVNKAGTQGTLVIKEKAQEFLKG